MPTRAVGQLLRRAALSLGAWALVVGWLLLAAPGAWCAAESPALPRRAWDAARARHRGPGPALWIGMPNDRTKTGAERLRYAGCTEPGATVRLDGQPLVVYSTGAFVGLLPLHAGRNTFTFAATLGDKTTEKTLAIDRSSPPPPIPSRPLAIAAGRPMAPSAGPLALVAGDVLTVEFHGTPGARAWFRIGQEGRRRPMREIVREVDGVRERGTYRGEYTIAPRDAFVSAAIRVGLDARAPGTERPSTVSALTGAVLTTAWRRIHRTLAAREDDTPLFAAASRESPRLAHVLRDTRLESTGRQGDFLRVRLGASDQAWVSASDFRVEPAGDETPAVPPPPALPPERTLAAVGAPTLRWDDAAREAVLRFPFGASRGAARPLPFRLAGGDGTASATLTLWGARLAGGDALSWRLDPNPLLRTVTAVRSDAMTLTLAADTGPCWGSDVRFADGALEWRLRGRPATAGRDGKAPLRGLKILLDPGHGGEDSGAIGAAGLYESDANLEIARRLARLLEAGGARAVLTRETDTAVSLDDRVRCIVRERPDLFLSIHNNSVGTTDDPLASRGAQTYFSMGHQQPLARCLEEALLAADPAGVRHHVGQAAYRVTRNCRLAPAALAECAFVSQPEDEAQLLRRPFLDSLAQGLYNGIAAFARGSTTTLAEPTATRP